MFALTLQSGAVKPLLRLSRRVDGARRNVGNGCNGGNVSLGKLTVRAVTSVQRVVAATGDVTVPFRRRVAGAIPHLRDSRSVL